jgi:hypothetical protein
MKKITKSLLTLALCVFGVMSVNAQSDNCATFENPGRTNAEWHADTQSFTWNASYYNQVHNIGLLEDEAGDSDISNLKNLTIDYEILSGDGFRVLFYQGGSNIAVYINGDGAYWDNAFTNQVAETVDGVVVIPIYEFLTNADGFSTDYLLKLTDICLSGFGGSGEVQINSMCVDTYGPGEQPGVEEEEDEVDPGWPAGDYIDFTEAFPELNPRLGIGDDGHPIKLGNGDVVVGQRNQDVIADLSDYSELTIVTSPGLKLVLYMNHEVAAQQNAGDYAAEDEGKYVFMDVQADENGLIVVDLTQFDKAELNCICLPWDNSNRGTVWYLLLTENNDPLVKFKKDLKNMIAQVEMVNPIGKTAESFNALLSALFAAQSELESVSATEASLTAALQSLEAAVLDLKYAAGFAKLTDDMFMEWDDAENPFIGTAIPGAYEMFSSTGMVYGDPSVIYTHFTDLTPFDYLYIAATEGTPRVIFNRAEPIDPSEEGYDDHGGAYEQKNEEPEDGLVTIDLKALEAGYAHLNAIKGYNGNTTVTELLVYAENSVINVGPSGYASYSGILNVELTDNDLTAYAATYADGQLTLTPISVIPADEAVIVKSNVEIEGDVLGFTYPNIESADEIENDLLISDGSVQGNGSIYALGQVDGVVGFYRMAENEVVPNGKAYLFLPDEARAFIALNGTVNGISEMAANRGTENKSIFNLAGQRVVKAQKGLYIQNGKKVVKN